MRLDELVGKLQIHANNVNIASYLMLGNVQGINITYDCTKDSEKNKDIIQQTIRNFLEKFNVQIDSIHQSLQKTKTLLRIQYSEAGTSEPVTINNQGEAPKPKETLLQILMKYLVSFIFSKIFTFLILCVTSGVYFYIKKIKSDQ